VNSVNASPTEAQKTYFEVLSRAHARISDDVRTYLDSLSALNEKLRSEALPVLLW
jgi:hypothetical protein